MLIVVGVNLLMLSVKNYMSPLRGVQEVEEREISFKGSRGGMQAWKNIEQMGPPVAAGKPPCFFL